MMPIRPRPLTTLLCLVILTLAGCGRALSPEEAAYMEGLTGPTFSAQQVRIVENPLIGLTVQRYPARPQTTCRERIWPPPEGPTIEARTAGIVLFNTMHVRPAFWLADYVAARDGRRSLAAAMFFAHEMTHVWQWQNRARTGYHPARAFAEHVRIEDPYLFDPQDDRAFLDYGYEVQASLVEEYVCCRATDPGGARTERLERMIAQVMPVTPLRQRADQVTEMTPWADADLRGVCS